MPKRLERPTPSSHTGVRHSTHSLRPTVKQYSAGTYYAAQLGISLKVKDTGARAFLLDLLDALEKMKAEIGPNDAIDDELASSAYVENFALRVFAGADNEDRQGNATRCALYYTLHR